MYVLRARVGIEVGIVAYLVTHAIWQWATNDLLQLYKQVMDIQKFYTVKRCSNICSSPVYKIRGVSSLGKPSHVTTHLLILPRIRASSSLYLIIIIQLGFTATLNPRSWVWP